MNRKVTLTVFVSFLVLTTLGTQFIVPVAADPTTIYVDDDNISGPWDGTVENPYQNMTSGIEHASAGDTIRVRAGTYNESITINRDNLMLIGENRETTIIDGGGADSVVYVIANNVTFSGFTIRNGKYGIWLWNSDNNNFTGNTASNNQYGIYLLRSSNNNFSGNTASNNQYGIYLYYSGSNVLSGNSALNNTRGIYVSNSAGNVLSGNSVSGNDYGIYVYHSNNNLFSGNTASNNNDGIYLEGSDYNNLTRNTVSSNNNDGIILSHSGYNVLSGNSALNNTRGIYVSNSAGNVLSGNSVSGNDYGIYLEYSGGNVLSGNSISNNKYGIYFWGSNINVLSGNSISSNVYGIYLRYSSNNTLTYNDASNNQYRLYLWGSNDNIISQSNFINNTEPVSSIGSVNSWDNGVEGNYWSDYTGADANRDGIGDTPYSINENNQDNYPLMAMLLQFNIATEDRSYKIDVVCNSTISNFYVYLGINALSFKASGAEGKGFCRICIPHDLIEPPYTVTVDYNPPLYSKIVHRNETHTWLYFTYEHSEHEIIVMHASSPEQSVFWSQLAILGLAAMTVVLLSISIRYYRLFREQRKVIQAYEGELGSFPVNHSERARARFIRDVIERKEKIEKFKRKYGVKVHPASTLKELMEKLGVKKEKEKS